jgi:hypothetical protein
VRLASLEKRRAVTCVLAAATVAAGLLAAPAQAVTRPIHDPAAGRVLGGISAQGWPVVMAISKNDNQVVGTLAGIVLSCNSGQQFTIEDAWSKLRIGTGGAVHAGSAIHPPPSSSGVSVTGGSHSLNGKLNRRTGDFSGVWHLQVNFSTSSGPDQCDSGNVAVQLKL